MLEMLTNPKRSESKPWEMFFIGLFYASVSFLVVAFVFGSDMVLKGGSGLLLVLFTVLCSLPYMYYTIKLEEGKDVDITDSGKLILEHSKAIRALMWLFLGFVVAFAFWYMVFPSNAGKNFNFQVKTFCAINNPINYDYCLQQHGVPVGTGAITGASAVLSIFANNLYVLIFTLVFSLVFGAGAIFILVWNASVISAAIGIFTHQSLSKLPLGLLRYMIHGIPEIAAYFIGALAGGIVSVAIIRKDLEGARTLRILQDALLLSIIAIVILFIAAIMEVYLTPALF